MKNHFAVLFVLAPVSATIQSVGTYHKGDGSGVTVPVFYLTLTLSRSVCSLTKWKLF